MQQRGSRSVVHVIDEGTRDRRERGTSNVSRTKSNEFGNRAPPPDVTIPQGDSSNFGMNTRRSVHMSSVRVKRNEGSVLFFSFKTASFRRSTYDTRTHTLVGVK